jgi:hypothetical protein
MFYLGGKLMKLIFSLMFLVGSLVFAQTDKTNKPFDLKECIEKSEQVLGPVDEFIVGVSSDLSGEEMDYKNGVVSGVAVGTFSAIESTLIGFCKLHFEKQKKTK